MMRSFINSLSSSQSYLHEAGKQLVSNVSKLHVLYLIQYVQYVLKYDSARISGSSSYRHVDAVVVQYVWQQNERLFKLTYDYFNMSSAIKKFFVGFFSSKIENTTDIFLVILLCNSKSSFQLSVKKPKPNQLRIY